MGEAFLENQLPRPSPVAHGVKCHLTWCKFAGAPAHAGKHADLVSVSSRQPSSSSTLNHEGLRGLRIASSDTIYPALLNRCLIGGDKANLGRF